MATFGKCVWDGCTRHAEKEATGACRAHHVMLRDARCRTCRGRLSSRAALHAGQCRRCSTVRAA
jgi:hypothetical protein